MVEVEEIELDLALSIGGTFGRPTVEKLVPDSKPVTVAAEPPREKREVQALRRIEATRKRERKRERVREPVNDFEQAFKRECKNAVSDERSVTAPFRMHHLATVQYLPLNNGSPLPCERNVGGGVDDVNGGDGKVNTKSNASSRCSSSVLSDYQSSSLEDGGSTDSHSHSVHSMAEPPHLNTSKEISIGTQKPEGSACASSHPTRPKQDLNTQERDHIAKEPQPQLQSQPNPNSPSNNNNALATIPIENSSTNPILETKFEVGKIPPKPLSHHTSSSLLQMPYVSTKGHNGKTVNGFLYRYTKSEVSIVCVCHGSTFSPAEFVQHAGGTDISNPLRHIRVIPSAFG